ncbi:polysaccharide deacetylase family protein [Streptomyces sp. NPDC002851]
MRADTAAARPVPLSRTRLPWIWMYHSIDDATYDPYSITVTPERLDHQLRWLRGRGLTGVSVAALLRAHEAGRSRELVGLTFDDGYADFLTDALPVLRQHGFTATVFVLAGRLDGVNSWDSLGPHKRLLSRDAIRAAAAAGMEIGSHGLLHTDLTRLSPADLHREVRDSRAALAHVTKQPPQGFCYPYGTLNQQVVDAVRAAGYAYACAIAPEPLHGAFALPRVHISQADRALRLRIKQLLHRGSVPVSRPSATRPVSEHR